VSVFVLSLFLSFGPSEKASAASSPREYSGVQEVRAQSMEHGVDLPVRFFSGARAEPRNLPPRPTPEDVFVDASGGRPARTRPAGASAMSSRQAPPRVVSPALASQRDRPPRSGLGLLIPGGVLGALAALARLPIIVVGNAHVTCRADPALDGLAPCQEQAVMHRAAFATSSGLYAASLPLLVSGARVRGQFATQKRHRSRSLAPQRARRRVVAGVSLAVGGALALVTSYTVGYEVVAGSCEGPDCHARLVATEVAWWAGAAALTSGAILLAHTIGRSLEVGSRRARIKLLPVAGRQFAGASLSGSF
jgi:hypothetical protein